MKLRGNYYVRPRDYASINKTAADLRSAAGLDNNWKFSVTNFILDYLKPLLDKKGGLEIVFFDAKPKSPVAKVTYRPLKLWVDKATWTHAQLGFSFANYVLAHEIGHIILHDRDTKAFKKDNGDPVPFDEEQRWSEWQANTFADCFLVSDIALSQLDGLQSLATACNVSKVTAGRRLAAWQGNSEGNVFFEQNNYYQDQNCGRCGSDRTEKLSTTQRCLDCGHSINTDNI